MVTRSALGRYSGPARLTWLVVVVELVLLGLLAVRVHGSGIDLQVYRLGAREWMAGHPIYSQLLPTETGALAFTYPPLAAIALTPLALLPLSVAHVLIQVTSLVAIFLSLGVILGRAADPRWRQYRWLIAVVLTPPLCLCLEPLMATVRLGQVNAVLLALVLLDVLVLTSRPASGVLIGIAAASKLSPLVFGLFFLLRRDYRALATMLGSFAVATGIGFALAPADSAQYWTGTVFDIGRVGNLAYAGNQSLRGMAARLFSTADMQTTVWVFAALVVLGLGVVAMRRCLRVGNTTFALLINAQVGLLVSPISWSHHWIWIAPALLALLTHGRDGPTRPTFVIGVVLTLAFVTAPHWTLPYKFDGHLNWAIWQQVPGNLYVILGLALIVLAACLSERQWVALAGHPGTAELNRSAPR